MLEKINLKNLENNLKQFFFSYEYQILDLGGIFSGLLFIYITNNFFVDSSIYYLLFFIGIFISSLGFLLEFFIKQNKRKAIEKEFSFFLQELSREYKKTQNLSIALANVSKSNVFGAIDQEIQRIEARVSWGDTFIDSLEALNKKIKSNVISHTILLLKTYENTDISIDDMLLNISKDIIIFKQEKQKKKYFKSLFNLSIVFLFIFLFVLIFIDELLGSNFLWYSANETMTRIFFDNFLLYIALLLSFFTAFLMYTIKNARTAILLRYMFLFFIIIVILFQVFIPKPEAQEVLIDTINYMKLHEKNYEYLNNIIAINSLSSKMVSEKTDLENVYFIPMDKKGCSECLEYFVVIKDALFLDLEINLYDEHAIVYYKKISR